MYIELYLKIPSKAIVSIQNGDNILKKVVKTAIFTCFVISIWI